MLPKPYALLAVTALVTAASAGVLVGWRFAIFILPFSWTGEPERIADLLRLRSGSVVADIGAGDGSLAVEMARLVGERGVVYATELSPELQRAIARRASEAGTPQLRVIEAASDATKLPDACCDAVYMRAVFHHIDDRVAFAREVAKAVRPGGRVAIIDFAPGVLWFHARDHGVAEDDVAQVFQRAGLRMIQHLGKWGGGTYLLLFERAG